MNQTQVGWLLAKAAEVDNRKLSESTVLVWHEILVDVEFGDAMNALLEHRRTSDAYLMPVHIVRGAKAARSARLESERITQALAVAAVRRAIEGDRPAGGRFSGDWRPETWEDVLHKAATIDGYERTHAVKVYWARQTRDWERRNNAQPNPRYDPQAIKRLAEMDAQIAEETGE